MTGAAMQALLAEMQTMHFPGHDAENPVRLMEVCGTHTMSIAKAGLKSLLPPQIKLLSGPGCPVCVTPAGAMDEVLRIAALPGVILATYGDLLRVPGSVRGQSLAACRANGARVEIVYSPMDAVALAEKTPDATVVFLGVGFETSAPGTAACVLAAAEMGLSNFCVLPLLKTTEPAVRALLDDPACRIDGLICPGHVATIIGEEGFRFLAADYHLPGVIAGFETEDVLLAVYALCRQIAAGTPRLENEYTRAVRPAGNAAARAAVNRVFAPCDAVWRGLGCISQSGLRFRGEYAAFDAAARFGFAPKNIENKTGCRCGEILRGRMGPESCPLFGKSCTPSDPVGPCMVSSEGACAAAYKYAGC